MPKIHPNPKVDMTTEASNGNQEPQAKPKSGEPTPFAGTCRKSGHFETAPETTWLVKQPWRIHERTERAFMPETQPRRTLSQKEILELRDLLISIKGLSKLISMMGLRVVDIE